MICKKKKSKYIYVFLLSLTLVCGLLQSSVLSCNSYASENTVTVGDFLSSQNFYDACAWYFRKVGSIPDAVGGGSTFTYNAFADYLESQDKSYILDEPITVTDPETNNASGGRGYDLPQDARQEIINYVNESYVEENPLPYTQVYIPSYNFLSPTLFPSYSMYMAVKQSMKQVEGYHVINNIYRNAYTWTSITYFNMSHSLNLAWIGTVNEGSFSSVYPYVNWQVVSGSYPSPWFQRYSFNTDGSVNNSVNATVENNKSYSNNNLENQSLPKYPVFTSNDKNELVYVFSSLNAYKNYNSGTPQPYYLLTEPNYVAPAYDPVTDGQLQGAGNFYNSIVNNVSSGQTPEETQKVVKNGLLGNLLDTLTGSNTSVVEDNGNFDMSFLGTIKDLVLGVTGAIDPAQQLITTDLKRFVTDIFGWLPAEIVTFWIAGILFSVLFGVLKIVRG